MGAVRVPSRSVIPLLTPPSSFKAPTLSPLRPDCNKHPNVTQLVVNVKADFTGHPTISANVLMSNAVWNLCLNDPVRRQRGEADLCW